jgi:hypothetical protein
MKKKNAGIRKTTKSTLYDIFEQTDVNDVSKFFYIINGGMLLHRLKYQTKKKKVFPTSIIIFRIPPPPGGTAILPEYIHYYG